MTGRYIVAYITGMAVLWTAVGLNLILMIVTASHDSQSFVVFCVNSAAFGYSLRQIFRLNREHKKMIAELKTMTTLINADLTGESDHEQR